MTRRIAAALAALAITGAIATIPAAANAAPKKAGVEGFTIRPRG